MWNGKISSCEELTRWKRPWCWEGLGTGGKGDNRGWDGWMASLTRWAWVWVSSGSWWWTGRPGVLRFVGSQRVGHDWATELNWTEWKIKEFVDIVLNHWNQLRVLTASYRNPTSKWNKHQWEFICSPNEKTLQVDKLCASFVQSSGSSSPILCVLNHPQAGFLPAKYDCRNSGPHVCA